MASSQDYDDMEIDVRRRPPLRTTSDFKNLKLMMLKVGITTNLSAALSVPVTFIPVAFKDGISKHLEYSTITKLNGLAPAAYFQIVDHD